MVQTSKNRFPDATTTWQLITPELGREFLASMSINRPLQIRYVRRLASDMKSGRWIPNTTPIKFNKKSELIDGQHRLHALIECGMSIPFTVAKNCDDREFIVQDIGLKRSLADAEYILSGGAVSEKILKTRMVVLNHFIKSIRSQWLWGTHSWRLAIYHHYESDIAWVVDAAGVRTNRTLPFSTPVMASVLRASFHHDRPDLETFLDLFKHGNAATPNNPVLKLRDAYFKVNRSGGSNSDYLKQLAESALRSYIARREVSKLIPTDREMFPLPHENPDGSINFALLDTMIPTARTWS